MINYDYITGEVRRLRREYEETDPDRLCRLMGVLVIDHDSEMKLGDFKGLSVYRHSISVILLNSKLSEGLRKIVLAHEIGHLVLHKELAAIRGFHDFDLFGMNDQCEHEANVFAAELLLDDDVVLDALNDDMTFFGAAKTLCVPPELLDFKFRVLKHQGYKIRPIMIANSRFLKHIPTNEY